MSSINFFGLSETVYIKITGLIRQFPEFKKVLIFGSRARGSFKEGSDIDLAVSGKKITYKDLRKFKIAYDNLNIPYQLDLVHYETIDNPEFKKLIDSDQGAYCRHSVMYALGIIDLAPRRYSLAHSICDFFQTHLFFYLASKKYIQVSSFR
jgi:predicted nucleotidyltransferase